MRPFSHISSKLGDNVEVLAWYGDNSKGKTNPVGQKQPNALDIYDMTGNVWEWVNDKYGDYPSSSQQDPQGPTPSRSGRNWRSSERFVRAARRSSNPPNYRVTDIGFRLASTDR